MEYPESAIGLKPADAVKCGFFHGSLERCLAEMASSLRRKIHNPSALENP
jgi:hypothetical protein